MSQIQMVNIIDLQEKRLNYKPNRETIESVGQAKIIDLNEAREQVYETCVFCFDLTNVRKDTPIEERVGYVECAGQTCPRGCENYNTQSISTSFESRRRII